MPSLTFDASNLRALIVDDNSTNREILQLQFDSWKIRNSGATNGHDALALLRESAVSGDLFNLVILDMHMPDMDGLALARATVEEPALIGAKLIMLTSLGHQPEAETLKAAGIAACLIKPVKQSLLYDCIATNMAAETTGVIRATRRPLPAETLAGQAKRNLRVLVAEDNTINQQVALEQLTSLGYAADTVANGLEALEALQRIPYDVVFMDCMMPEMDGYEASTQIRLREQEGAPGFASRRPVHIIAMTANAMQGDREKCLAAGMNDYLSKPVRTPEIRRLLEKWETPDTRPEVSAEIPPAAAPVVAAAAVNTIFLAENEIIPPVDLERLLDITSDDPVRLRLLTDDYFKQGEEIIRGLDEAIENGTPREVRHLAHKLRGSSATCGMTAIVPPLAKLEAMAAAGELAGAADLYAQSRREFERVHGFLDHYFAHESRNEKSAI